MSRRLVLAIAAAAALSGAGGATATLTAAGSATVVTYPAAQTISPTGRLPSGAGRALTLNEPVGGDDAALVVVSNARQVGLTVDTKSLGPIGVQIRFRHFVRFGSLLVPDALLPWDGSIHRVEQQNQPLSIEVSVPYGTKPGTYKGSATVTVDTKPVVLPLTINVYGVALPKPGDVKDSLLTVFGAGPQSYVGRVIDLFKYRTADQIRAANDSLFAFLSAYRIAPDSWGYGIPHDVSGYTSSSSWWKDSAGNMIRQLAGRAVPRPVDPALEQPRELRQLHRGAEPGRPREVVHLPRQRAEVLDAARVAREGRDPVRLPLRRAG